MKRNVLFLPRPQPSWPDRASPHDKCTTGAKPTTPMGFFRDKVGVDGGNLGGLQGADAHCQKLARGVGQAGQATEFGAHT